MALDLIDSDSYFTEVDSMTHGISRRSLTAKQRLVVALDKRTVAEALSLVRLLGEEVAEYKVGLELLFAGGLDFAQTLKNEDKDVFLDMKLLDIPNTIEKSVANVARLGFDFLTVHGIDRKTLDAAVRGRNSIPRNADEKGLKLLSVTVLTSSTKPDLEEQGFRESSLELAVRRARMAKDAGFDGVIASSHEARAIRQATDADFIIKVPGIRPSGTPLADQSRAMTPREALWEGADYLVVGRPIYDAVDPVAMVRRIRAEIEAAQ